MNSLIDFFYSSIFGAALLLSALGLWFTAIMPVLDHWSRRFFRLYFIILMVSFFVGSLETVFQYYHAPNAAIYILLHLESFFPSLPLLMLTAYLLRCCGENIRQSTLFRAGAGLLALYFVLLLTSLFITGVFSSLLPDGQYDRGRWYPLVLLPIIALMLLNLAGTIRRRKLLSRKTYFSFLIAIVPITVSLLVQLFVDVFPLVDISIVLSALSMYGLILSDQIEQDLRHQQEISQQQLEIANQRANVMVLQMRPHFIYNTMTSIYCLCKQDPEKARQVTLDFTNYLRRNFSAVASAAPIPFSSELEHTSAYLAVEQAQYEDSLFVDYDTPHIQFRVPPLTLQPIVENAVKHGRDPYAGAFHISIRTRKTDSGSEIVVEDDGRGLGSAENSEPHIALSNIRQRLKIMCGGTLEIESCEAGGTRVRVFVPLSKG